MFNSTSELESSLRELLNSEIESISKYSTFLNNLKTTVEKNPEVVNEFLITSSEIGYFEHILNEERDHKDFDQKVLNNRKANKDQVFVNQIDRSYFTQDTPYIIGNKGESRRISSVKSLINSGLTSDEIADLVLEISSPLDPTPDNLEYDFEDDKFYILYPGHKGRPVVLKGPFDSEEIAENYIHKNLPENFHAYVEDGATLKLILYPFKNDPEDNFNYVKSPAVAKPNWRF
jgi:hypothetical protein